MSGSRKLNNKSNVIYDNFKLFRLESGLSQRELCEKLELIGLQLYKADIYSTIVFDKPIIDFFKNSCSFLYNA